MPKNKIPSSNQSKTRQVRSAKKELKEIEIKLIKLMEAHSGDASFIKRNRKHFLKYILDGTPFQMMVLAADIRKSTFIMKEAINLTIFSNTLSTFINHCKSEIFRNGGWFDKFTGDGFLAYWIYAGDNYSIDNTLHKVCDTSRKVLNEFNSVTIQNFRSNSRNFPDGIGLSLGIDAGPSHIVEIADDLTIVGPAVVGAVRMVSIAEKPMETLANVYLGEYLTREGATVIDHHRPTVKQEFRKTKEYEAQEVYLINFTR